MLLLLLISGTRISFLSYLFVSFQLSAKSRFGIGRGLGCTALLPIFSIVSSNLLILCFWIPTPSLNLVTHPYRLIEFSQVMTLFSYLSYLSYLSHHIYDTNKFLMNATIDYILFNKRFEEPLFFHMQFFKPFRISLYYYLLFHFKMLFNFFSHFVFPGSLDSQCLMIVIFLVYCIII